MTIHTNRGTRLIKIECDNCSEVFDPGTSDLGLALHAADQAGWSQHTLGNNKYEHHCSRECRIQCERDRGDV